jgi:imidazole glycerol-phosphate synthase subunit HisF
MLKKRLVFTLLVQKGVFQLSRNFSLQAAGNIEWLCEHYELTSISRSIDELTLLNVTRGDQDLDAFCECISQLSAFCFMPIAAGGGIQSVDDAYRIIDAGADKLVLNSALFSGHALVRELVKIFGSQSIVASIDYKCTSAGREVLAKKGKQSVGLMLEDAVRQAENLGVGELYVTSIDRDGTGQGYDLEALAIVSNVCRVPVIASGGVGDFRHLLEGLQLKNVTGVSTANIYNFLGDGLTKARRFIEEGDVPLAQWNFDVVRETHATE